MSYFDMKLVEYNEYLISTVDTDGLMFWPQGINSHSAAYALMNFQLFRGQIKMVTMKNIDVHKARLSMNMHIFCMDISKFPLPGKSMTFLPGLHITS